MKKRLIVGITGATGAIYGVEILKALQGMEDWESHVVLSEAGALNLWHELKMRRKELETTLRDHSERDALTGLYNRRWIDELSRRMGGNPEAAWGCIYLDLVHFK